MTKTLVIHIGGHKTGSTTIQEAFAARQVQLAGASIQYPARLDHNYLRADIISHVKGTPLPTRGPRLLSLVQLSRRIQKTKDKYILLSAEYFECVEPRIFKDIVDQHFAPVVDEIKIVAYVRPHAQRLLSGYSEALKIGWFQDDLEAFFQKNVTDGTLNYAPRFAKWRDAFGDAFILRPMIAKEIVGGSVLDDFLATAFPGERVVRLPQGARNQSLDLKDQVFVQLMQEPFHTRKSWFKHTFGWELARQLQAVERDPDAAVYANLLHQNLAIDLVATYAEDAVAIDTMFFDGKPLFRDALSAALAAAPIASTVTKVEDVFDANMLRNVKALRAVLSDVLAARYNWPAHFHGQRIKAVENHLTVPSLPDKPVS
jgi:hypothetical protein